VKIAFGTDAGTAPWTEVNQAAEFGYETRVGMMPLDAIRSATILAAELMGIQSDAGSLAVGKWADIIACQGDPLTDVSTLLSVDFVMKAGQIHRARPAVSTKQSAD
jgi:imidazolonepropionase-like amidohydrolase